MSLRVVVLIILQNCVQIVQFHSYIVTTHLVYFFLYIFTWDRPLEASINLLVTFKSNSSSRRL